MGATPDLSEDLEGVAGTVDPFPFDLPLDAAAPNDFLGVRGEQGSLGPAASNRL